MDLMEISQIQAWRVQNIILSNQTGLTLEFSLKVSLWCCTSSFSSQPHPSTKLGSSVLLKFWWLHGSSSFTIWYQAAHDPTEDLLFPRQISSTILLPSSLKEAKSMQMSIKRLQRIGLCKSFLCSIHEKTLIFPFFISVVQTCETEYNNSIHI